MLRFLFKFFVVLLIFFVGVLFGLQKANTGIVNMRGYQDPQFNAVVSIEHNDGEVNASLLGQEVNSYDLEKKKEQLQEIKAFNMFSNVGQKISEGSKKLFSKIFEVILPD